MCIGLFRVDVACYCLSSCDDADAKDDASESSERHKFGSSHLERYKSNVSGLYQFPILARAYIFCVSGHSGGDLAPSLGDGKFFRGPRFLNYVFF